MRWRRGRTALWLAPTAVAVWVVLALMRPHEPAYGGRPLSYWIGRQAAGSFRERADASQALARVGPEAVPALTRMLSLGEHRIGQTLRTHLSGCFPGFFSAPPNALSVRLQVITLLTRQGPLAAPAAPALVERLEGADPVERQLLEGALAGLGNRANSILAGGLDHPSLEVRTSVAKVIPLSDMRVDVQVVLPALQDLGRSKNTEARCAAARALTVIALRHDTPAAREAVLRLAQDPDPLVAFGILSACGPTPSPEGELSIESLEETAGARETAPPAPDPETLGLLLALLEHPSAEVRAVASARHWKLAHNAEVVLPVLTDALEEPAVIWVAAAGLRAMGAAAEPAIPALLEAVEREPVHRPDRTPATSAMALAAIGPAALPGLLRLLDHPNLDVRLSTAHAIRVFGPAASKAVAGLLRLLREPSAEAKTLAGETLGAIGPAANAALPELEAVERTSHGYPQAAAAEAIRRIRQAPIGSTTHEAESHPPPAG